MSRKVTEPQKKKVAGKQFYKCANKKGAKIKGLEGYDCVLWKVTGENKGCFDESGYEIDHKIEHVISKDDKEDNLQALCKPCHSVKTKRFNMIHPKEKKKVVKVRKDRKKKEVIVPEEKKSELKEGVWGNMFWKMIYYGENGVKVEEKKEVKQ